MTISFHQSNSRECATAFTPTVLVTTDSRHNNGTLLCIVFAPFRNVFKLLFNWLSFLRKLEQRPQFERNSLNKFSDEISWLLEPKIFWFCGRWSRIIKPIVPVVALQTKLTSGLLERQSLGRFSWAKVTLINFKSKLRNWIFYISCLISYSLILALSTGKFSACKCSLIHYMCACKIKNEKNLIS